MLFIHDTVGLCKDCYRHVPAFIFEKDGKIFMKKKCPFHGESEIVIEPDAELFHSLKYTPSNDRGLLFEVTDKCQLECPHCYHLPDNKTKDRPLEDILEQVKQFPKDSRMTLAGAEPTLRNDFVELVKELKNLDHFDKKVVSVLTNGIKFSSLSFAKASVAAGMDLAFVGLNHYSYNGITSHQQQLVGINNLLESGCTIGYIGYTIETLEHIPDVLEEIQRLRHSEGKIKIFRIRCGSFIGRSSDKHRSYISHIIKAIQDYAGKDNIKMIPDTDHNIYHINILWNDIRIRVIQWPDVETVDMEELNMGPYCQFYGKPITNFVHQVIIRDAYKNMKFPLYDGVPYRYSYHGDKTYWRDIWHSPIEINDYDYKSNQLLKNRLSQF